MLAPLRHFLLVVEHGTFREAARRAHLSQPALSASIQKLERELGAPLLDRSRRGATATEAGRLVEPHARAALGAVERAREVLAAWQDASVGRIRIAAGATVCTFVLPPILAAFRARRPAVSFALRETTTEEAHAALAAHEADLAIVTGGAGRPLLEDELILVAPRAMPDARGLPFVAFRHGAGSRELLDRLFPERPVAMELGSIAAVLANVRSGAGISLVSRFAVEGDGRRQGLRVLTDRRTPIRRQLMLEIGQAPSPAARAFAALLTQRLGRRR